MNDQDIKEKLDNLETEIELSNEKLKGATSARLGIAFLIRIFLLKQQRKSIKKKIGLTK